MENQEKITLLAEISALEGQVIKDFDAEAVRAQAQQEYTAMQQDIVTQYEDARMSADVDKQNKQSTAAQDYNSTIAKAKQDYDTAISAAEQAYTAKMAELDSSKANFEQQALTYFEELKANNERIIASQEALAQELSTRKERLAVILAEEEEARKAAEEAAKRLAQEQRAKQMQAAAQRPKIRF